MANQSENINTLWKVVNGVLMKVPETTISDQLTYHDFSVENLINNNATELLNQRVFINSDIDSIHDAIDTINNNINNN